MNLKIMKLSTEAILPKRGSTGACGIDLYALFAESLYPMEMTKVHTGIAVEIPPGYFGWVTGRSGIGLKGILTLEGKVDEDYRGEIIVGMLNTTDHVYEIDKGIRFAQLVIMKYETVTIEQVVELGNTTRGINGFGSTGSR